MAKSQPHIMIVDDEESICQLLEIMLTEEGYWARTAQSYEEAMRHLETEPYDLIITDIMMPDADGLTLLKDIKKFDADLPVILITAYASLSSAVDALRQGAFDYITKPFQMEQVKHSIKRALETRVLRHENRILKKSLQGQSGLDKFIGTSSSALKVKELVHRIASTNSTVLITGESGTGKELLARAIHNLSDRTDGPFITINCAALPETLLESELFGYVKGAFTGANKDKEGLFEVADGGTFFLDEVGETSLAIQAKLLRILETSEFTPLGATKPATVNVRLIAATNSDLHRLVDDKRFRQDLFYRLNVLHIHIPPLRERREDVLAIVDTILKMLAERANVKPKILSPPVAEILTNAYWEGNVRELENVLERAMLLSDKNIILPQHLPAYIREQKAKMQTTPTKEAQTVSDGELSLTKILPLEEIEKAYIFWALTIANFNKSEASRLLGIDLSTLYRKIEKYDLKKHLP